MYKSRAVQYRVRVGELYVSKDALPFLFNNSTEITLTNDVESAMLYSKRDSAVRVAKACGVEYIEMIATEVIDTCTVEALEE